MTPLDLLKTISFTGPNSDGEYWLHIKKQDNSGAVGVCLGSLSGKHFEQWEAARQAVLSKGQ